MRVLTAAGERFAVDGRLLEGRGEVDESLITGETAPRAVAPGALIHAGTVNLSGSMVTEATATDDNTLLAEIARLMTAAEQARGRYVRLADRAARFYAPAVHILGLATFLGWLLTGHGWESALTAAIAVLIITCPCALALAVPAVQVAATSRLFGRGVLIKAPDGLERLAEIDTVVFDKTGTHDAGPAVARRERRRQRRCARRRRAPRRRQPPSLRARRGTRRGGQGSRRCSRPATCARSPGFGPRALGGPTAPSAWAPPPGAASRPGAHGRRLLSRRRWHRRRRSPSRTGCGPTRPRSVAALQRAGLATELLSGDRPEVVSAAAAAVGHRAAGKPARCRPTRSPASRR